MKFFTLLLFFTSLNINVFALSKDEKLTYMMMGQFAKQMKKEGFDFLGTTLAGVPKGKLKMLGLVFRKDESLDIVSARKLGLSTLDRFLFFFNSQKKIGDYFVENPLTEKSVRIGIIGQPPQNKKMDFIHSVSIDEGILYYYSDDMSPPHYGLLLKETIEQARQKLIEEFQ